VGQVLRLLELSGVLVINDAVGAAPLAPDEGHVKQGSGRAGCFVCS
jgi:hypothetical protein